MVRILIACCKEQIYMNPKEKALISIFSTCLRNMNATNRFLTSRLSSLKSVYFQPEHCSTLVSENAMSMTSCQRVLPKIATQLAERLQLGYFDKILKNVSPQGRKYFLFISKATILLSTWK